MSLDTLTDTLKQFLLKYKSDDPDFDLDINEPLLVWEDYQGADTGDFPKLVYEPQSFTKDGHGGKTKREILREQEDNQDSFPGWIVHLLQPSNPSNLHSPGFVSIPREGRGIPQGDFVPRHPLEAGKSPDEYLSILQKAQGDKDSPYHGETGMTPEDWIMAFMIHFQETGELLDDVWNPSNTESHCFLTGAFFPFSVVVPGAYWCGSFHFVSLDKDAPLEMDFYRGVRSSVMI
ncbi:MAG: hypothetical protein UX57_C0011G0026 [Candidatus Uhrbacteria bacterium GW2011_GWE2_46_68]|uniref:Uncharacterized protein n=2 Tax=Candidatus Uhriibacteriota TaxID=1752732 RepID=A0A0G1T5P7_9BACT|nr:MAG: hypothetical protein UX45_C0013G0020 [Candidatus Uhrbacteria bacterium GW2011_GWF2_46_218]KKU40740.1 MAG: hypothetical protein UX57_C0011G0026 [Candidatus Uhrbacteria bacterium GW2011_GWE2_46_68]